MKNGFERTGLIDLVFIGINEPGVGMALDLERDKHAQRFSANASSWSSSAHQSPVASASAEFEQAEMCPFFSRNVTFIRASVAAVFSRNGLIFGSVEASSAMQSSQRS